MPVYRIPMTPRQANGLDCPLPGVPVKLSGLNGRFEIGFVLDTGAAVTLVPVPMADDMGILYNPDPADTNTPQTLQGHLTGHHGRLNFHLGTTEFNVPCFFYNPPGHPPPAAGPAGAQRAVPPARSVPEWEERVTGTAPPPRRRYKCVLGRLGFLNKIDLLVRRTEFLIATDSDKLPPGKVKPILLNIPRGM